MGQLLVQKIFRYIFSPFLKNEKEIQSLNGIRAIAILLVIIYHVWLPFSVTDIPKILQNVLSNFNSGVDLFFVLSGFLIYSGILKYREQPDLFSKKSFFIARTFRIFPAYYFCLFILYFYYQGRFQKISQLPNPNELQSAELNSILLILQSSYADFFYVSNYTEHRLSLVGWSLSIEEQFYLILPFLSTFLLFKLKSKKRIFLLAILYLIPLFFRIFYFLQKSDISVLIYSHTRIDSLIAGMILGEIQIVASHLRPERPKFLKNYIPAIGILFLLIGHGFPLEHWFRRTFGFNFFNIGFALLVFTSIRTKGSVSFLLGSPFLRPIARLSYTMYLWNILIAGITVSKVIAEYRTPSAGVFLFAVLAAILCCFLFSWILYLLIERPFLILKERILSESKTNL
ncbi:acyltransferase [Leptospira sp. 201903070]|uniref:Acyltransferase n=1 Tax=Leptospira ainlahdjerensis TaxID=2810033 RepID=A0ABS2UAY3_9LEPT|nr:acyltransferase [Leptospira ainlahdjerensis]MBM9577527.1 acyltransferase [Leptospira ainlahdjerensis]